MPFEQHKKQDMKLSDVFHLDNSNISIYRILSKHYDEFLSQQQTYRNQLHQTSEQQADI